MSGRLSPHKFEMCSIRPYQDYSFRCWFSNNSVLAFVVIVLSQDLVSLRSFHSTLSSIPEALWCSSLQPIFLFCQDHVLFLTYPFNRSVVSLLLKFSHFIKSCIPSQPECYPDRFLLFLFLNGVLWTLFSSVVSFLPICSTPQGSWFHSFVREAT